MEEEDSSILPDIEPRDFVGRIDCGVCTERVADSDDERLVCKHCKNFVLCISCMYTLARQEGSTSGFPKRCPLCKEPDTYFNKLHVRSDQTRAKMERILEWKPRPCLTAHDVELVFAQVEEEERRNAGGILEVWDEERQEMVQLRGVGGNIIDLS